MTGDFSTGSPDGAGQPAMSAPLSGPPPDGVPLLMVNSGGDIFVGDQKETNDRVAFWTTVVVVVVLVLGAVLLWWLTTPNEVFISRPVF